MTLVCNLVAACLATAAASAPAPAQSAPPLDSRLAGEFMRAGISRTYADALTTDALEAAILLANEALALQADSAMLWHIALDLAVLAENEPLKHRALEQLSVLDPDHQTVRLMRLTAAIERFQSAQERIQAYERLLDDANIQRLGPEIASRLCLDLALLHQRLGNIDEFARALTQALRLDRANRAAAAVAAGFFRMHAQDAFGEAELLVNLVMADPTDLTAQVALAQLLLEHGAYIGAARMYQLATRSSVAAGAPPSNALLADMAVAQWARGDDEGALQTIRDRQRELDILARHSARDLAVREQREISALDLAKIRAPDDPVLATVRAAILVRRGGDAADGGLDGVMAAYRNAIETLQAAPEPAPADLARLHLELAWVQVWLGNDAAGASESIATAQQHQPLSDLAQQRFSGWMALRQGDAAAAIQKLRPLAEDDIAARLGLAIALLASGEARDAARELLAVNRAQPGSMIGIWAAWRLADLLGSRMPLSDLASRLEQLIAGIPSSFERYPQDPSLAVGLRVIPADFEVGPYESLMFDVEVTNSAIMPLALDRDGPLRPQVLIIPNVQIADAPQVRLARPFVLNLSRKLSLQPNEKLVVTADLRQSAAGDLLNLAAANGALVRLTALINFSATQQGNLVAGLYGREIEGPRLRVEGVRMEPAWVEQTIVAMQSPREAGVVERMAILSHWIQIKQEGAASLAPEDAAMLESARNALQEAFAKLDGLSQAWLLAVMARGPGFDHVLAMAQKTEHRLVRLAYLLYHIKDLADPMLDAAKRGDDPILRRLAELIELDANRRTQAPGQ